MEHHRRRGLKSFRRWVSCRVEMAVQACMRRYRRTLIRKVTWTLSQWKAFQRKTSHVFSKASLEHGPDNCSAVDHLGCSRSITKFLAPTRATSDEARIDTGDSMSFSSRTCLAGNPQRTTCAQQTLLTQLLMLRDRLYRRLHLRNCFSSSCSFVWLSFVSLFEA